jgi:hypothetical protein
MDFPFNELTELDKGIHIVGSYENDRQSPFDFWVGGREAEHSNMFVPQRGLSLSGFRAGEQTEDNLTKRTIQQLLALNSNPTEAERKMAYLDLAYGKVFSRLQERFFLTMEIMSSSPKFVLMTRDIPVYFLGFCDKESMYLMWSNEAGIEERMRAHYGERFYYYRMKPFLNGMCVIQSVYLKKKIIAWRHMLQDNLMIMNALEVHLFKRLITEDDQTL